jgi:predicted GTPase
LPAEIEGTGFDQAIAAALASGDDEMTRLKKLGEDAIVAYSLELPIADGVDDLRQEVASAMDAFAKKVQAHLAEQQDVLSTFNIAFFGRTGAGKSTLLSAFGQLDGSGVSPGDSDWTTEVQSVAWRGCRLYDTPGINGWGGRKSRGELEATARRAVEVADVVLLCFDSQSQQASEFSKVAKWVHHFGKPTIAVLNIRNLRWRHPARVPNQNARANISAPVRQHADNIRTELAGIGLPDTPVVAIHSRRALFARASAPYRGPAERDFVNERELYGIDYLARWSNFRTLEALLTNGITAGGAELRLRSLREGMRAILQDEAGLLEAFGDQIQKRFAETDRVIARHLEVLGYLESDERAAHLHDERWSGELLTIAETARCEPYLAPAEGAFSRYLQTLLKPELSVPRGEALRRFKDLEHKAFSENKDIDQETFAAEVFDDAELDKALENVWAASTGFLERELSLASAELKHRTASEERETADLAGAAGSGARAYEVAFKGSGILTGLVAAAGTVALGMSWNPIGWAAGVIVAGVGITSSVLGMIGGRQAEAAEKQRAEARSRASYAGRVAIRNTFDGIEKEFARRARSVAWEVAAGGVRNLLREAVVLARLRQQVASVSAQLDQMADTISETPHVDILDVATQLLEANADGARRDRRDVERVLLGEDWFDAQTATDALSGTDSEAFATACRQRHDVDMRRLHHALSDALARPDTAQIADWTRRIADAARLDAAFQPVLRAASAASQGRPSVAIAGDFSSGKSSFIKRLLVEVNGEVPESLIIRADPTTEDAHRYRLAAVDIVDTPGFQSGRRGHDEKAVAATSAAALVIVLLHVNLLIGDTARLEGIVNGTDTAPGKWPRMLFLINRCDELGIDPLHDIAEFFNRRDRKAAELHAALSSRGIEVEPHHIHGVAADPFSAVGGQLPVTRANYDDNREWDGVDAFLKALRALSPSDVARTNVLAALDNAALQLLELRSQTVKGSEGHRREADRHATLIRAMDECLDDAKHLSDTFKHILIQIVSHHTNAAVRQINGLVHGDDDGLKKALESWKNKDLQADVEQFMASAAEDIEEWAAAHESAINRQLAAMNFFQHLNMAEAGQEDGSDTIGDITKTGGAVTAGARQMAAALGTRDAAYGLGKLARVKFKPWGAVKAGRNFARGAAVLQAAFVAFEAANWAWTERKKSNWENMVAESVKAVEEAGVEQASEWLDGEDGPVGYLGVRRVELEQLRGAHRADLERANVRMARDERRLNAIAALLTAFDDLRKRPV